MNTSTMVRHTETSNCSIQAYVLIQLTNFHHAHPCPSILQCLNMTVYIISGLLAPQHGSSKAKCHWVSNVSRIFSSWISQQGRYANAFVMKVQIQMKLLEFRPHSRCPTSFYWSHQVECSWWRVDQKEGQNSKYSKCNLFDPIGKFVCKFELFDPDSSIDSPRPMSHFTTTGI